ncbi:Uncharacterized protein PRO82_000526 [Candidatus Protochlamydia amoebophila]|uniref:hypothetical protein n=1 Tax=Candidatus Protochlamydia amoebophila TaxID=362787 RepID=UPI001BC9C88D|nr:hypothetical protein [Candidatus Protochlamydia amoebophila]MBS4163226.1 Uncharacterized protein [Candidatus Protochlamydia amoebophila]
MLNKSIYLFTILILGLYKPTYSLESESYYQVSKEEHTFSTIFDMTWQKQPVGTVVKSVFHLTTEYDLYNRFGLYEAKGICRLISLGTFFSWGTAIDLFDIDNRLIGFIEGKFFTQEAAQFNFYNEAKKLIAIAILYPKDKQFKIVDPIYHHLIASLTYQKTNDNMDLIAIYKPKKIPAPYLKIFSAFACDANEYLIKID